MRKINLEITPGTKKVIEGFDLDPQKIKFWREGLTAFASYKKSIFNTIVASTDIEEDSSNAMLMYDLCSLIRRKK